MFWSLRELAVDSGVARSTTSEDLSAVRQALEASGAGRLESASGPGGGVCFRPSLTGPQLQQTVRELAETLAKPDRVLPGGFLYMTDILFSPDWSRRIGECFAGLFGQTRADVVVTVETKGIPIALMTARALGLPLVLLRRDARVTEGPSVSISYLSGSAGRIQSMSVPRRALAAGARGLIIDDFMKGGGTARGMVDLLAEVGAQAVGIGVLVVTTVPAVKRVAGVQALLTLEQAVDDVRPLRLRPAAGGAVAGAQPTEARRRRGRGGEGTG